MQDKEKEALFTIVEEMTTATTGAQNTKHWSKDALWFDIAPFASRGIAPAVKMFDSVFERFSSCHISILEKEIMLNETMGIVCTVQKAEITWKTGVSKTLLLRQTDCFQKIEGQWLLIHQHVSVPAGGEWDGRII